MKKIVFLLVLGVLVGGANGLVEAATNSSSLPVPPPSVVPTTPTPVPTPTPVVTSVPTPTPTPTPVEMPVTASDDWTYGLIIGGIAACVFATYKVNLKKKKLN
jgi:cell division septation protein DedD